MAFHFSFIGILWNCNNHSSLAVIGLGRLGYPGREGRSILTSAPATYLLQVTSTPARIMSPPPPPDQRGDILFLVLSAFSVVCVICVIAF